jgi:XTP/dITP diphosphohydrolase
MSPHPSLEQLIATMATLRGDGGCPWDAEQTHESLVAYLLEEVFELVEALESGSRDDIREELGDVLYQVLFHADIASTDPIDPFTIDDVAAVVDRKMQDRHPHVFADGEARTVAEVTTRWAEIKAEQKAHRESRLDGIPAKLSALARTQSVLRRSLDLAPAKDLGSHTMASEAELGEALFDVVALAHERGFDAERALRSATRAFEQGVREAEARASSSPGHEQAS